MTANGTDLHVSNMFLFSAFGVLCLALIVIALYLNGLRHREPLRLNKHEIHLSWKRIVMAAVVGLTALACAVAATSFTGALLPWAGLGYFSLCLSLPLTAFLYKRLRPPPIPDAPEE